MMNLTSQEWLTIVVVVLIVVIFIDGFRRMRNAKRDALHMSLDVKKDEDEKPVQTNYGSEFPNGGARPSGKQIDQGRIEEVKKQYDFGSDISNIIGKKIETQDMPLDEGYDENHTPVLEDQWVDIHDEDEDYYADKWDDSEEGSTAETQDQGIEDVVEEIDSDEPLSHGQESQHIEDDQADDEELQRTEPILQEPLHEEVDYEEPQYEELDDEELIDEPIHQEAIEEVIEEEPRYQEPEQASFDLDESVPVLMDKAEVKSSEQKKAKKAPKSDEAQDQPEDLFESIRSVGQRIRPSKKSAIEPTIGELDESELDDELETRSANKPRYQSKYFSGKPQAPKEPQDQTASSEPEETRQVEEVLVINIKAREGEQFAGSDILQSALENGLRYGAMDIFHYHQNEDGEGPVVFSMANMLMPGVFDLRTIEEFSTVGITLFLTLPVANDENLPAFETMLAVAKNMSDSLNGELKDDQRNILTAQTMEHYRERIRDFVRRQKLGQL